MSLRNQNKKNQSGFTLIELLVVVAIIGLLASLALIGLVSAREKSRNVKRLADMTQMNTALELYNSYNKGYPSASAGVPINMTPTFLSGIPVVPNPADGFCDQLQNPQGITANPYYYYPTGTSSLINGQTVWSEYEYYFCLGAKTGDFSPGVRTLTPRGIR